MTLPEHFDPEAEEVARVVAAVARVAARVEGLRGGVDGVDEVAALPALGRTTRLAALVERAGLDGAAVDLLRVLVAAEFEVLCLRQLARLGDGEGRPGVAVDALMIAGEYLGRPAAALVAALAPAGPLVRRGLVCVTRDDGTLAGRRVAAAPRVVALIVGPGALEDGPRDLPAALEPGERPAGELVLAAGVLERARAAIGGRAPLWLIGPRGVGKRALAAALAAEKGKRLLVLPYRGVPAGHLAELCEALWRESLVLDAIPCIAELTMDADNRQHHLIACYQALARARIPVVLTSTSPPPLGELDDAPVLVAMDNPGAGSRTALWRRELPGCERLEELASHFRLPPGRIVRVAAATRARVAAGEAPLALATVTASVSAEVEQKVAQLGTRVEDSQTWDDLVLPRETYDAMREIVARARHRHRVLTEWGFQRKLSKGTGLAALFSGPPGTGKTMVAGLVARELGLELYQIDLSRVVSKYVGETEKNLAEVFEAADWGNVMLLFDEADALFGKRTEVKSSNDRFANIEINYLLQRIERFEGITILTTNLEGAIDPAFKRRLAFRVSFPMPDENDRQLLWRRMLPPGAPLEGELDFKRLARRYEFTGGNIRNAMLRAAFLAAGEGNRISMAHVERAIALEYQDAGMISIGGRLH